MFAPWRSQNPLRLVKGSDYWQLIRYGSVRWLLFAPYDITHRALVRWMSPKLKLDVKDTKTYFSFKVIFFIPEDELSNSFKIFLVLCFISLLSFYKRI